MARNDDFVSEEVKASIPTIISEICLGVDLEPDAWIKDSGCSKYMTGNRKLFSSYKTYNGGNVIFGSNLRGNIIGKGQICDNKCRVTFFKYDSEITKNGKVIGRGIRKKGLYVMKIGNKPRDQICLATIDENSTLWHRRLGHANMRLIQSLASKELVRNLPKLKFDQHFYDTCKMGKQAHASHKAKNIVSTTRCLELLHMDLFCPSFVRSYGGNRYTLFIVDGYSRKVKESLNLKFDETPPPFKTSPLVDDDLDEEEAIKVTEKKNLENDIVDETLEIDKIVNIKESRNHPLENVIGNLNQRTLRSQVQNQKMLKKFGLEDSKPMKTPMSSDTKLTKDEECESVDSTKYRGMIGSLLYLTASRPDIMFSVCLCACFQEAPKTSYLEAVKRIFRYIKGTTHLGLWYPKWIGIETVVYADSDHAGDYVDRKITSAENVSAKKACQQALWVKQALIDYDIRLDDVLIMCDNKGTIDLSKNPVQHSRTRHIEIRHHFFRNNVQKGHISIEKVPSVDNIADILTKPLKRESFNYLRLGLGMIKHIPWIILVRLSFFGLNSSSCSIPCRDNLSTSSEEFWAIATGHHHAIRFKMDNKKHVVNLESLRDMLHICPRVPGQSFVEPPFKEEILSFIHFLGHSAAVRKLTDVNINKLYHPWRFFAAIINKCLTRKSSGYDSLRLSHGQILWGLL
nr:retrovirus-related Pol polyprotein from transposon TNT 1-94 [Tanacetum cinerariifolium]